MVEHLCKMVRSKLVSDPGPEPIRCRVAVRITVFYWISRALGP